MNFVYPGFLFALSLLAVPVIIHLFNFRRFKTIYFSNVKFLRNIQEETATRNRLKHWLVLLMRCLALAFLVLAFAQPFLPAKQQAAAKGTRSISIYVDNSFSMDAMNNDRRLLDIAKAKAEEIVGFYNADDKFQVLTNDFKGVQQRLVNKDEALDMIREIQISPETKPLNEVFRREKDVLNRDNADVKQIYFISDFQKNQVDLQNDTTFTVRFVPLASNAVKNVAIDSVWFITPVQMINQTSQLCVKVKNYGDDELSKLSINLKLNDNTKAITDITIPAHSEAIDTLSFAVTDPAWQKGEVSVTDYPVTFDDAFYFSFKPVSKISVLCINGRGENEFIESVYGKNSLFYLENDPVNNISFDRIGQFSLIILNDALTISSGLADALTTQINEGASVLIFPAMEMDKNSVNTFLRENNAGLYGDIIPQKRDVTQINTQQEVFAGVFEKIPKNLTLPYASVSYALTSYSKTPEEPLLSFADGQPFFARYQTGKGAVYLSSVPLDRDITDFPVQGGLFVPLLYRVAILGEKPQPLYVTIGREQWISFPSLQANADEPVKVKNNDHEFIPMMRRTGNGVEVNISNYASAAGIYALEDTAGEQGIALNYDRHESDLSFYSGKDLEEKFSAPNVTVFDKPEQHLSGLITQLNEGTALWKYCIIFALLFLAGEILIIRFLQ